MRISHLLVALLFGLSAVLFASAQSPAVPATSTPSFDGRTTAKLDLIGKSAEGPAIERYQLPARHGSGWNFGDARIDADPTCFVMRTYRMTRVDQTSDVVQPGRTTICETQRRYSVRSAAVSK